MRRHIQIWGTRFLSMALIVFAAQHWGTPLYKQYFTPKKAEAYVPTTTAKEGKFVVSFHEIGTLQAENTVAVSSEISGKIISIVSEGSTVKPGDKLVELDTTEIDRDISERMLSYRNALRELERQKGELELLKERNKTEVAQAEKQLEFDKSELARSQELYNKKKSLAEEKLLSQSEVDQAGLDVRTKQLGIEKNQMALDLKKEEVKSKEKQQQSEVDKAAFAADMAKSSLDQMHARAKHAVITASTNGMVVLGKNWRSGAGFQAFKVGDMIERRQMVCELPDLASMQVKVNLGESDTPKIHLELPVIIHLDAIPNKIFHGTVKNISSLATEKMPWETGATPGKKNFEIVIAVEEIDPKSLKPGMTADVEFICDTVGRSVYVPIDVVNERDGKTFVFVKRGKRFERIQVKTGKENDNFICVTKGLSKGQIIALRDPALSTDEQNPAGSESKEAGAKKKTESPPIPNAVKAK
ncbi:MAG: HlyD family efflux transporter periplasmic adaptor subunit [Armatimonadota bacterium]|nr:HlyD family efflux transporter periplasmic adaptor subunit [Armatimonadota bacterium]